MNARADNGRPARKRRLTSKRHPKGQVRADINVTPLVDVVLVLLIIFMVVTPMIGRGVSVQLPITTNHDKKNDDNKDIIVSISQAGEVFVNADKVPTDHLTAAIEAERRRTPDKGVFLKADHRIDYGQAREAMEAIHRAGVEDVQLGTDEKHEAAAGAAPAGGGG
ncbi:MAG TPA: biopolymer transporter ExbD [Polyangia bacterium]|jgi:biopolymer transport protein ExbD